MPPKNLDPMEEIRQQLGDLQRRVSELESRPGFNYIVKTTAGDPASGFSGLLVENTASNTLRIYTEGAFRTIIAW